MIYLGEKEKNKLSQFLEIFWRKFFILKIKNEFFSIFSFSCSIRLEIKFTNLWKELSFCNKLTFSKPYIFATWWCKPLIFQTINSGRSNSLNLKYQKFTPSVCKDIWVRKFKFVAKTQFLYIKNNPYDLNNKP